MKTPKKQFTVAVSVALQDAGEATRSLALMKAVRAAAPEGLTLRGVFLSHGSRFEQSVLDAGFEIFRVSPALSGVGYLADLKPGPHDFVGDPALAEAMFRGEVEALSALRPDLILHGFWPFAGLARRMVRPVIPAVCFLPLPFTPPLFGPKLLGDVPDFAKPLTFLPARMRRALVRAVPPAALRNIPMMRQNVLRRAAERAGWRGARLRGLFDMLKADLTIVNDFPDFYRGMEIPSDFLITGPLYAEPDSGGEADPAIAEVFRRRTAGQINVFCSMGSSGREETLLEAVRAAAALPPEKFSAVILSPKAVCPIERVLPLVRGRDSILVTDRFVPALLVNAMADVAVIHGGQGTVQTALACGCPFVGTAMQPEQQINLEHAARQGAGIRIPLPRWNRRSVQAAVLRVAADRSYRDGAERLARRMTELDGASASAQAVWRFVESLPPRQP